jgi:protein O-GlcNAc transferase
LLRFKQLAIVPAFSRRSRGAALPVSSEEEKPLKRAVALHRQGRLAEAEAAYRDGLRIDPANVAGHSNLSDVLYRLGRFAEAAASGAEAVRLQPDFANAQLNLGNALSALGRLAEAEAAYRAAIRLDPGLAGAHHGAAIILANQGRHDTAEPFYRATQRLQPDLFEAHHNLAWSLLCLGRLADAEAACRAALRCRADVPETHRMLGDALMGLDRLEAAVAAYREAVRHRPGFSEAQNNLGIALDNLGRRGEAEQAFGAALRHRPDLLAARANLLGVGLPIMYRDEAEIDRARAAYEAGLRTLLAAPLPVALDIDSVGGVPPFYLAYQGRSDRDLQALYGAHVTRVVAALHPDWMVAPVVERPGPGERIRVGLLSPYFHRHSNWKIPIKGWLAGLNSAHFALHGYHIGSIQDDETAKAAALCHRFVTGPRGFAAWAETIRADRLHVLLIPGIGLDTLTTRLAALKLAPVQASSWGHPDTSGLPSIDHFLSSELMEPADGQAHYTEKLIRLPNLSIAYDQAPAEPIPAGRAEIGVPEDATFYWCCQSLFKYLPQHDWVFAHISAADSAACFGFITFPGDPRVTAIFRERLGAAFAALGLDAERHCRFLPQMRTARFLGVTRQADLFLDSLGWSGCNTTLEALSQDLPVVTTPGPLMRGRHSAAILTLLGLTELIAPTAEAYVALAASLGRDPSRRQALRGQIALTKHRLFGDRAAIAGLAQYLTEAAHGRL